MSSRPEQEEHEGICITMCRELFAFVFFFLDGKKNFALYSLGIKLHNIIMLRVISIAVIDSINIKNEPREATNHQLHEVTVKLSNFIKPRPRPYFKPILMSKQCSVTKSLKVSNTHIIDFEKRLNDCKD